MRVADFYRLTCVSRTDFLGCDMLLAKVVNASRWVEPVLAS